jgi:hypothetical protein
VLERRLAIRLDLLGGGQCRSDFGWLKRCNECACHGVVDLHAANVEAVAAASLDKMQQLQQGTRYIFAASKAFGKSAPGWTPAAIAAAAALHYSEMAAIS